MDPNAGWSREASIKAAKIMLHCNCRYLEQPLPGWDLEGLSWIRKSTGMPIMVDESVWTPQDVVKVADAEAADIVNIKITKTCGLKKAMEVYNTATAHGLPCIIGTELESCMGLAAKLHIAAFLGNLPFACEFTELAFQKIALRTSIKLNNDGTITVPSGSGLGVEPDLELINRTQLRN